MIKHSWIATDTERLRLREFEPGDWPVVHRYHQDPRVAKYMWWGGSEQDTRSFIQAAIANRRRRPRVDFELGVARRDDGILIGECSLNARGRPEYATCELGYCFAPEVWGRGYAREAVLALIDFGFGAAGLHRIFALADPPNAPSIRLLERLGFRREGHMRKDFLLRGEWRDSLIYAMLDEEWREIRRRP